jgi:hypothetical protein
VSVFDGPINIALEISAHTREYFLNQGIDPDQMLREIETQMDAEFEKRYGYCSPRLTKDEVLAQANYKNRVKD